MSSTTQTRPSADTPNPAEHLTSRARLIATVGAILALALASIDISIVSTAMPRIASDLHGLSLYSWVGVGYAVSSAVLVPVGGKLGDMFGRKPFLLVGILGLLVMSLLCGMSQNMTELVAFRTVQGLFGGILMANIFTLAADIYTAEKRTQIQGLFFSVSGLSMVVGPLVGGLITDHWSWRWIFYIAVPIGLIALVAIMTAVPRVESHASWRDIDFLGMGTLVLGLVPILIALSLTGDNHTWLSAPVLVPLVFGAIMLVVFYRVETRSAGSPVVPFELFKKNQFRSMIVVAFFSAFAMMGTMFYVPLLYQGVLGVSATYSGSLVIPLTLALMIVPAFASKALTAIPKYRVLGVLAFALMMVGFVLLTQVDPGGGHLAPLLAMILIGVGIGISFPMATSVVQSSVDMKQIGAATSQVQFWRMIAGPVCLALLGSIMASRLGTAAASQTATGGINSVSPGALAHALHVVFFASLIAAALGLIAAALLHEVPLIDMKKMMKQQAQGKSAGSDKSADAAKADAANAGAEKQSSAASTQATEGARAR